MDFDFEINDQGTIVLFTPMNDAARAQLVENTDGTWWGPSLVVEYRYAQDLANGLANNGFHVGEA